MTWRLLGHASLAVVVLLGGHLFGCDSEAEQPGTLVVTFDTDMAMPGQIDNIVVQVQQRGVLLLSQPYDVGPHDQHIPATLTLVQGKAPSEPVTVRVAGTKQGSYRTYREVITTVPSGGRSALLRMPIQWLCDGTARSIPARSGSPFSPDDPASNCSMEDGYTCKAGSCVSVPELDSSKLPLYEPHSIWGGAESAEQGACFDTIACMVKGVAVTPDADCTIAKPEGDRINVALRVVESGICDETGTLCFVPLDAENSEGWTTDASGERIALPPAVCEKLANRTVSAVYASTECESKTDAYPPCGEWSSVPDTQPITAPAGKEAPRVALVTPLLSDGSQKAPCCPLMSDDDVLYTCICDPQQRDRADLIEIDLGEPDRAHPVGTLELDEDRNLVAFAAAAHDGTLYHALARGVVRQSLGGAGQAMSLDAPGEIYQSSSLLADDTALYMLATDVDLPGATDPDASPVQLLRLSTEGSFSALDTGANRPVYQFAQDDSALFLATSSDEMGSGGTVRSSAISRIEKRGGARSPISPTRMLRVEEGDPLRGGYVGVQVSQAVFGLFEGELTSEGTRRMQVHAFPSDGSGANGEPRILLDLTLDAELTELRLIGAADGAAVLSRIEYTRGKGGEREVRSGAIIVITASEGLPRAIADFAKDYATRGLVASGELVYWLNSSGKLYSYPREGLQ